MPRTAPITTVPLVFRRDDATGPGCIEFSWLPTGMRRHIILPPGDPQGIDEFTYQFAPGDPQIVQIYVLNNDGHAGPLSIEGVQYPPGTGTTSPIVLAFFEVFSTQRVLRMTFNCADGSTVQNWAQLEPMLRQCPQPQREHGTKAAATKKSGK